MLDAETHNKITLQSTSLIRGKTGTEGQWKEVTDHFNPLPSSEGRRYSPQSPSHGSHFNPLPSSEGRQTRSSGSVSGCSLQSTSLIRGKTPQCYKVYMVSKLQSTSLIRGKTSQGRKCSAYSCTSIHFPHPREDTSKTYRRSFLLYFNPLPSSEGRRKKPHRQSGTESLQSTSLIRGKTLKVTDLTAINALQSTSLIRGKTNYNLFTFLLFFTSIHFPHPREDSKTS